MPELIRHSDVVPTKVGNHLKDWGQVFNGNPGFRLEFIPMKIGAGMTNFYENHDLWTGSNNTSIATVVDGRNIYFLDKVRAKCGLKG
jgi:hypothetical protein